jgi:uncharacterized protein (TIGR02246 family)
MVGCTSNIPEPAAQSPDLELVKAEIQAIENEFANAFNTRNAEAVTYYAENAVSYFAGQAPVVGREAIIQHIREELEDFPEGAIINFETREVYVTNDGENVAEIGAHTLVDSTGSVIQSGHYFSFFAKKDGKYRCTRDMANSVRMFD